MDKPLTGKRPTFHQEKPRTNTYRIMLWLVLIVAALGFMLRSQRGEIKPLFEPTPTPTRMARSFIEEAGSYFAAGKIDDPNTQNDAIDTYKLALQVDPKNAEVWAQLARIQVYSSALLSTREQQSSRMDEAVQSIGKAVTLDPDTGSYHAIRAFVLDWSAPFLTGDERTATLNQALDEAIRALQLDPNDGLAMAFYSEVQLDQQKWTEAQQYAEKAVQLNPDLMDTHRVYATVLETLGQYRLAIEQYDKAISITPNLTFLYIQAGVNYRQLEVFPKALEYFEKAANINQQLGVRDPLPYIAIAKTYTQMGEFFIASLNAEKALSFNPAEANTYGQLGIIYFKAKNYESAMPALQCAVVSCTADQNLVLDTIAKQNPSWGVQKVPVTGLPLESIEIAYYYAEYGQALAYLNRPNNDYCAQAIPVLEKVRNYPQVDSVLLQIVNESEIICNKMQGSTAP
jgi:tetratricopeptide (TPR) repeat protein